MEIEQRKSALNFNIVSGMNTNEKDIENIFRSYYSRNEIFVDSFKDGWLMRSKKGMEVKMKQLHKNKWFLIGLILVTFFSSTGSSLIVVAETLDFSESKVNPNDEIERNDTENTEDAVSSSKNESTQTQETTDKSHMVEENSKEEQLQQSNEIDDRIMQNFWITRFMYGTANDKNNKYTQFPTTFSNYFKNDMRAKINWSIEGNKLSGNKGSKIQGTFMVPRQFIYTMDANKVPLTDTIYAGAAWSGIPDKNEYQFRIDDIEKNSNDFRVTISEQAPYQMKSPLGNSGNNEGKLADFQTFSITIERIRDATHTEDINNGFWIDLDWIFNPRFFSSTWFNDMWYKGFKQTMNQAIRVDFQDLKMDEKLTAEPVSQKLSLGEEFDDISPHDLVTNVKLGNQTLNKDEYEVAVQNSISTDIVGNKTAKALITYKKDTSKTLTLDVPVEVLWGNSIVYGGYNYVGNGRTTAAFTLNNWANPFITAAQGGTVDDNLAIHSNYPNEQYYTFSWFDLSSKQTLLMTEEQNGTSYIQANGNDLKKDKLKGWGNNQKQEVHYGDVVRAWQAETGKNWLYENEQRNSYNEGKRSVYYEITKNGYRTLHLNHLETKNITIPIYSTEEYLDKNIKDYIDLKGYSNIRVKEFSQYPNTKASGQQTGKVIVEETLTTGKKVQYEYEVTFTVGDGTLEYSTPKTLTFKEFTKSKSEQIIQRMDSGDLGLKISDNRGQGKQGNWRLTAQVNQSEELSPYLIFRDGTSQDKYLNQGAVEIYSQAKQSNPTEPLNVEVSGLWTKDTGILLKVPPKNNLSSKQYTSTITWNLVEGP